MKVSVFCVLFFVVVATALMFLVTFSGTPTSSSAPDKASTHHGGSLMVITSRKLKENGYNPSTTEKRNARSVNLEDYRPIDPSPTTKASIRPGPIEHGSPLIPYIPKPSPPGHPKNG